MIAMRSSHSRLRDKIKILEEVACWQSMQTMYAQVITSRSEGAIVVAWNPLAFNNVTNALSNYCTIIIQAPVGFFINHWT